MACRGAEVGYGVSWGGGGIWRGAGRRGPLVDAPVAEMDELGPVGSVEQQLVLGALRGNAVRTVPA